jgi:hypothetical protein
MLLTFVLMSGIHWIPDRQRDFAAFCIVWKAGLEDTAAGTAFGWDRPAVLTLLATINGYLESWETFLENNSTFNCTRKNTLMKLAKREMAVFAEKFIRYNDKMTEEDKNRFSVYTRDPTPTPVPKPATSPVPRKIDTSFPRRILMFLKDSLAENNAKPKGMRGAEMCWIIMDRPPLSKSELVHSTFCSNNRIELNFDESDRGKRLYFMFRWETTATVKGEFGEIYSVIIP